MDNEPTIIPAYTIEDGKNIILLSIDIHDILLRICVETLKDLTADSRGEWKTVSIKESDTKDDITKKTD